MSRGTRVASGEAANERLQRTLEENQRLKAELRDREEKLKRVQTQFRKLSADWRASQDGGGASVTRPGTSPAASLRPMTVNVSALPAVRSRRSSDASKHPTSPPPPPPRSPLAVSPSLPSCQLLSTSQQQPQQQGGSGDDLVASRAALAQAKGEIAQLRAVVQQLQQQERSQREDGVRGRLPSLLPSTQPQQQQQVNELLQELARERAQSQQQLATMQQQLFQTQADLQRAHLALQQQQHASSASTAANATAHQQLELQHREALDKLTRERDGLVVRLRLLEEERKSAATTPQPDPLSLIQLQGEVRERSAQVTLLNSRLQNAQAQVETLKGECARLVEELKFAHNAHAEVAKQIFQLEHEKSTLLARCGRLDEVELVVQRKNEELLRMEQELLKMMDSLRTCNADTEQAVRCEMNARIADLQTMRDEADANRREKERALLRCQADLADAQRRITSLSQDVDVYRVELSKAEKEKAEMAAHAAFAGHTMSEFSDEEVHRALAVAAMRRRGRVEGEERGMAEDAQRAASARDASPSPQDAGKRTASATDTAADALDLYDALHWDSTWEQGQLREALATAALDMELAETRCQQLADQVEQHRELLRKVSDERDTLLEENVEMRRRITGVQTVLAKQQLQAYRAARNSPQQQREGGSIDLHLRGLHCVSPAMERALGVARLGEPVTAFFTLDGLAEYDTMLSPGIHTLQAEEPLDIHFRYEDLDHDEATVGKVRGTTFLFQLHLAVGTDSSSNGSSKSSVVAMAELPGTALLVARETTVEERLPLIDGDGNVIGTLYVDVSCSRLMLPILLGQPLADVALLSAAEMRSVLVALRSVRSLRVQLFKAQGLPRSAPARQHDQVELLDSNDDGHGEGKSGGDSEEAASPAGLPQPYVFYTAGLGEASFLSCIRDTVVHTANNAFTTEPVFDAAPVDHRVVVDRELVRFISQGSIVFVLFDERATDVRANLGMVEVPLRPLLASPQAVIRGAEPLHPQGTLHFGVSWVTGP